ncbi:hypothetical protein LV89_02699 [Arcicella aurantiaca]|uniref:Uncharacterized protein n=1 Tax=Arcicella aurantiaca TaxID=591202 RepID=A0A316E986_9BACT|nr:hypothetical protein LV89_02699 [Arcicella aurantiaca]
MLVTKKNGFKSFFCNGYYLLMKLCCHFSREHFNINSEVLISLRTYTYERVRSRSESLGIDNTLVS